MKKARNGATTPTEKEKNDAAIKAQKEKRAAIQAASDKRKEEAMAPRRAKGLPATPKKGKTTLPAGEGSMKKYMNAGTNPSGSTKAPQAAPKKTSTSGGGKRKIARTASAAVAAPKREMPGMTMSKPSTPGIQKGPEKRNYSSTESKIMEAMQKGKQADGTMSTSAQMRIKALKAKESSQKMRAENKSKRMEKRAAVKAVKKSYK